MAVDLQQLQAEDTAYAKQAAANEAQRQTAANPHASEVLPSSVFHWLNSGPVGRATLSTLDSAVSTADSMYDSPPMRKARDVAAGAITGATNIADAVHSGVKAVGQNFKDSVDPSFIPGTGQPTDALRAGSPIWDHAKKSILDFRDAVAVQDPTLSDNLIQGVSQLAIPLAGYSRLLSGVHGIANMVASGAATDATALAPHDVRTADLFALGRHTEGKLGEALRALAPDGSALNAYINFLGDRSNETEAGGRFKNVLDGFGANLIVTPLLHAAGVVLKQGTAGLRYSLENGVGSAGSLMPAGSRATQEGKIGWHGTPSAPFDAFDDSRIGTGQGAQSFGHGHYIAENAETGETYQKSLSARMNNSAALSDARSALRQSGGDKVKAYQEITAQASTEKDSGLRQRLQNAARIIKSGTADQGRGSLLKVEIPDTHIENMLDLDKPLEKQPEILNKIPMKDQTVLQTVLDDHGQDLGLGELTGNEFRQLVERAHSEGYMTGKGEDGNFAREASEYLGSRGIPGNKYFDRKSRITGEGTRNYVVFDGKNIKVLGKEK